MKSENRRGKILYWGGFSAEGKLYTGFENRGKLFAGALFPPMGEILFRARFSGGKDYAGGNLCYNTIKLSLKVDQDIQESEMFVKAMVNGTQCNLLLDTGATLTILSVRLYAEIDKIGKMGLSPIYLLLHGELWVLMTYPLPCKGKDYSTFHLGRKNFIGLDFLQTNQCVVDICKTKTYVCLWS
jgi:hypothetical protein